MISGDIVISLFGYGVDMLVCLFARLPAISQKGKV